MDLTALPSLLRQMAALLEQQGFAVPVQVPPAPPAKKKPAYKLTPADRQHIQNLVKKALYGNCR